MTDEIDIMRNAIKQYDKAIQLKKFNEELYAHLSGSLYYLWKYAEKHEISLPEKECLLRMMEKADYIIDKFHQPTVNTNNNSREDNSTILMILFDSWKLVFIQYLNSGAIWVGDINLQR